MRWKLIVAPSCFALCWQQVSGALVFVGDLSSFILLAPDSPREAKQTLTGMIWLTIYIHVREMSDCRITSEAPLSETKQEEDAILPASSAFELPDVHSSSSKYCPPLYVLIIGIDTYLRPSTPDLRGAVADADAIENYVLHQLNVPANQIITLRNGQATRKAIIEAWDSLRKDERIKKGDPILIYYAGHGARAPPPEEWKQQISGGETKIELLVPCDVDGETVHPVADRTIALLMDMLSNAKGDNIVSFCAPLPLNPEGWFMKLNC